MLEWIILACFVIMIIWHTAKAITKPMIRNFMNLVCIPVAFGITAALHKGGLFKGIMTLLFDELNLADWLVSLMGEEWGARLGGFINGVVPVLGALAAPVLFVLTFHVTYLILKILHVTLICRYIRKKNIRTEKRELKKAINAEKERLKKTVIEEEAKSREILESLSPEQQQSVAEEFKPLDDDDIEDLVEDRVKEEKKRRKKQGYFKESADRKLVSILVGALTGFLLFAVTLVPVFYHMEVIGNVTDTVLEGGNYEETDEKTTLYLAIEFVDEYIVNDYENSFVIKLYKNVGIINLLNKTTQSGAEITKDSYGDPVYANNLAELYLSRPLRLACASLDSNYSDEYLRSDMEDLLESPLYVNAMDGIANLIVNFVTNYETQNPELFEQFRNPNPESEQYLINTIVGELMRAYQREDGSWSADGIKNDMDAVGEVATVVVENKLLAKIIAKDIDAANLIEDRTLIDGLLNAMVGMTAYTPAMKSAFTAGVSMIAGAVPGVPADNAAGYDLLLEQMVKGTNSVTDLSAQDMADLQVLFKGAALYKINDGKIAYIQDFVNNADTQIATSTARIAEIDARILEIDLLLIDPSTTDSEKETLNTEKYTLNSEKNTLNYEIEILNEEKVKLNAKIDALIAEREASTKQISVLDYILDSLYVAELIKEDALAFQNEATELYANAEALLERVNTITTSVTNLTNLISDLRLTSDERPIIENEIKEIDTQLADTSLSAEERTKLEEKRTKLLALLIKSDEFFTEDELTLISNLMVEKTSYKEVLDKESQQMTATAHTLEARATLLAEEGELFIDQIETRINTFTAFINYFINWMSVQKPFMISGEDKTSAGLSMSVDGALYVCNTDSITIGSIIDFVSGGKEDLNPGEGEGEGEGEPLDEGSEDKGLLDTPIEDYLNAIPQSLRDLIGTITITGLTEENADEFDNRVSPFTNLINFLILSASEYKNSGAEAEIDREWLFTTLGAFTTTGLSYEDKSEEFIAAFLAINPDDIDSKLGYDYKGITLKHLNNALKFETWEVEGSTAKYDDTKKLVDIIFSFIEMIPNLSVPSTVEAEGGEGLEGEGDEIVDEGGATDGATTMEQMKIILDLLAMLGKSMDLMAETECLGDLPAVMVEIVLKNPLLGQIVTPGMVNNYMNQLEAEDFTYEAFMKGIAQDAYDVLVKLNEAGGIE